MAQASEPARIGLVAGSSATACELCTAPNVVPATTVIISHTRGGIVQLGACDWCVRAVRRLSAASGGQAAFALSEAAGPPPSAVRAAPPAQRAVTPPVLIKELFPELQDSGGINYVVRVLGRERIDGTWEGLSSSSQLELRSSSERAPKLRRATGRIWLTGRQA